MALEVKLLDSRILNEVRELVKPHSPQYCYQCAKCTSACTATKVIPDYKPHLIVALTRLGFVKNLLESGIVWACTECWKCSEYCPQNVAPVEVVIALKNLSISMGYKPPEDLKMMAKNLIELGYISPPIEVLSKEFEMYSRSALSLPELVKPYIHEGTTLNLRKLLGGVYE
ncbi:MAG: 4Fe-4S dicluster domain-containing protein [Sulfolobales archaeon]